MPLTRLRERLRAEERATILPLIAVLILVLLGFAAIGVDASAAFAEKRQARSAADAGVLAGAIEYLDANAPTGQEVADAVIQFATTNAPGIPPSATDWETCTDPDKPPTYVPLIDGSGDLISDCISLKQVSDQPTLLRVRLPNWDMPTSFAGLIGFNSVAISATATAEIVNSNVATILPTSLPAQPGVEECLGSPPQGQLPPGDVAPCDGPAQGNFGLLNSPWFGAADPHFTGPACEEGVNTWEDRAAHALGLGLDHQITAWPDPTNPLNPLKPIGVSEGQNPPIGGDDCSSANGGVVPYILLPRVGNTDTIERGLIGNDASSIVLATTPGKLRQNSSPLGSQSRLIFNVTGWPGGSFNLDNVGLWEYIDFAKTDTNWPGNLCKSSAFASKTGRELTDQMKLCLAEDLPNIFVPDLLVSPRFALVPVLNYQGPLTGQNWWAVRELRPVYIQTTWYDCDPNDFCLFNPDNLPPLDVSDDTTYSWLFNPGEGTSSPCFEKTKNSGSCVDPGQAKFQLQGFSGLVFEWTELPDDAENQLGSFAPVEVFLHDNE